MSTPMVANSSRLVRSPSRKSLTSPLSGHFESKNLARISVWAKVPFSVKSVYMASHWLRTLVLVRIRIKAESGSFCVSKDFADRSFFSHKAIAADSSSVGLEALAAWGLGFVPSKCPQKPFASTASWKRIEKIAQFRPEGSRRGIEVGRWSESAVDDTDITGRAESVESGIVHKRTVSRLI